MQCIRGLLVDHVSLVWFFVMTRISVGSTSVYIIPLTDNEGYVSAMNRFLLVRVRAGHHHRSLNQSSSSCVVRIPSHMLGFLGSTYIKPYVSRP